MGSGCWTDNRTADRKSNGAGASDVRGRAEGAPPAPPPTLPLLLLLPRPPERVAAADLYLCFTRGPRVAERGPWRERHTLSTEAPASLRAALCGCLVWLPQTAAQPAPALLFREDVAEEALRPPWQRQ